MERHRVEERRHGRRKDRVERQDNRDPGELRRLQQWRQREDSAKIPASVWRAVIFQGLTGMELQSTLPMLKAPAMLIWGGKDPIIGEADRASLTKALPTATVKLYPDLGHNPFWEQPETLGRDITDFLRATS